MTSLLTMRFNFSVEGKGQPVILLHGWGGSIHSLRGLQLNLAKSGRYKVYNLELPGFGESPRPQMPWYLGDYVYYLNEFIKELGHKEVTLVGHSFGGKISMKYAFEYPDQLESLILINSSGIKPNNSMKKKLLLYPTKIFGAFFGLPLLNLIKPLVAKLYYKAVVGEKDYVKAGAMKATLRNILTENLDHLLANIMVNTLVIWAENDTETPLWMGQKIASTIPRARLEIVQEATHGLPLKSPNGVANLIDMFLSS